MDMEHQDGYCDGLSGKRHQSPIVRLMNDEPPPLYAQYLAGYVMGVHDRDMMLEEMTLDAFALWAEGMGDGDA